MTSRKVLPLALSVLTGFLLSFSADGQSTATAETRVVPVAPAPAPAPVPTPNQSAAPRPPIDSFLAWNHTTQEITLTNGSIEHQFFFSVTNISKETVSVAGIQGSCGCTTPHPPALPWILEPGAVGDLPVTMNVVGKTGTIAKTVTLHTDKGSKVLIVKAHVLPPTAQQMASANRDANQKLALVDRQAVLRGDCATCHVEPAKGLAGQPLYEKMCGVCHEAEHRASMVPDLHALKHETNAEYWRNWITHGKPGTLMPAFAAHEGGVLNADQIESLVKYLTTAIPGKPGTPAPAPPQAIQAVH